MTIQIGRTPCLGNAARTSHCGPNQKHYHGSNRRSDETRTLIGSIPAERLSQVGGNERADDAQNCREDEALRLKPWLRAAGASSCLTRTAHRQTLPAQPGSRRSRQCTSTELL